MKKREEKRLEAAQMKFLRHLLGITKLDKEKYQCIREKTGAQNIVKEIKQHQKKWLKHVQRMDRNRIPKQALRYRPKETKLRIHNITAKAASKFGSEALGTEEKRGTTFRSSTHEIFETLTGDNKIG